MADAPKPRYFTCHLPVFQGGIHYAPGVVFAVPADKCNGRKFSRDSDGKPVITKLDVPSQHFKECNSHGGPLGTNVVPPTAPAEPVVKPQTMSELGKHENQKGKRPSDRDI